MATDWAPERQASGVDGRPPGVREGGLPPDAGGGPFNGQRSGAECYICRQVGHSLRDCPQAPTRGVASGPPSFSQQEQRPRKRTRFKSVSWASDDKLRQVRLFSSEDAPAMAGTSQQQASLKETKRQPPMPDLPPGFGAQAGGGVHRIRTDSAAVAAVVVQFPWRTPPPVELNPEWQVVAGGGSMEVAKQQEREKRTLEAMYPRLQAVPESPQEPLDPQEEYDDSATPVIPILAVEDEDMAEAEGEAAHSGFDAGQSGGDGQPTSSSSYAPTSSQVSANASRDWNPTSASTQLPPANWQPNMPKDESPSQSKAEAASQGFGSSGQPPPGSSSGAPPTTSSSLQGALPAPGGPPPGLPRPSGPSPPVSGASSQRSPSAAMAIVAPLLNSAAMAAGGGTDITAATAAAIATMSDSGLIDRELLVKILSNPNMIAQALAMQGRATTAQGGPAGAGSTPGVPPGAGPVSHGVAPALGARPRGPGLGGHLPGDAPSLAGGFLGAGGPASNAAENPAVGGPFPGALGGAPYPGLGRAATILPGSTGPAAAPPPLPQYPPQEKGSREPAGGPQGAQPPQQQRHAGEPPRDQLPPYLAQDQPGQPQGNFSKGQDAGAGPSAGFQMGMPPGGQARPPLGAPQASGGYPPPYSEPRGRDQGMLPQAEGAGYPRPMQFPPLKPAQQLQYGDGPAGGEYDGAASGLAGRGDGRLPDRAPPFDLQVVRRDRPGPRSQEDDQNGYLPPGWAPGLGRGKPGASPRSPWDSPGDSEGSPGGAYQKSEYERLSERHGIAARQAGGRGRGRSGRACAYFNTPRGCRNGASCPFVHDATAGAEGGAAGTPGWGRGRGRGEASERDRGVKRPPPPLEEGELVG